MHPTLKIYQFRSRTSDRRGRQTGVSAAVGHSSVFPGTVSRLESNYGHDLSHPPPKEECFRREDIPKTCDAHIP